MELSLPPLRDRTDDIPILMEHFMGKFNKKMNRDISGVSADVARVFMEYPWPGNIRELEHALEHAYVLCRQSTITLEHLPKTIREFQLRDPGAGPGSEEEDRMKILRALEKAGWNKARAARLLGMDRKTLYRKLTKYNINGDFSD
jgi:DNA-binding NtrC family response regulator